MRRLLISDQSDPASSKQGSFLFRAPELQMTRCMGNAALYDDDFIISASLMAREQDVSHPSGVERG